MNSVCDSSIMATEILDSFIPNFSVMEHVVGDEEMFLRTFPQMKRSVEDSGILDDLEVQEIPDTVSENSQDGGGQYLVIREEVSGDHSPCDFCENKKGTDPDEFFSRLPDELWIGILRDLSPLELCIIGLTCKALLRLTR